MCGFAVGLHDQGQAAFLTNLNGIVGCWFRNKAGIGIFGIPIVTQPSGTVFPAALLIRNYVEADIAVEFRFGLCEYLHGKQKASHAGFHVGSSSSQDQLVCHFTGERIKIPLFPVTGGDHVHMTV